MDDGGGSGGCLEGDIDAAVGRRYAPLGCVSFLAGGEGGVDGGGNGSSGGRADVAEVGGESKRKSLGDGTLPPRKGNRPTVPPFVAPQRQTDMQGTEDMIARMEGFLHKLAAANPAVLEIRPSGLEGAWHAAVFLKGAAPEYMGMAKGEIVHVHPEGSSHVTVSLADGEQAVAKGW